ncbi:hypothetical protein I302_100396 [Kwoniella bestiolae CBS 10118]|uniref:Uncharacterized protein n=1 Tax=Kwoniella bestiolae CBS 10118 TaxID=1296100 RepID=A0A1B9G507_9TREE|nr:hypothetical protein I302_03770 [Kwoniella bestiolae CBS 10118]OCF26093.1 hypothetical protein I302_03770 [Kwoniella bestiolae CBS 10118]
MPPKRVSSTLPSQLDKAVIKVRSALEKDKGPGWQKKVEIWAEGKKKVGQLLLDPQFSYTVFEPYMNWAKDQLLDLVIISSVPQFLTFFYTFLDHLYEKHLKDAVKNGHQSKSESIDELGKEDSPEGITIRVGKTISLIVEDILQLYAEERIGTHVKALCSKEWILLIADLLDVCLTRGMGEDILQSTLCELIYNMVSDSKDTAARNLLKDDSVLGFERIGSYLFRSEVTGTSIWLLRIVAQLLPPFSSNGNSERSNALRHVMQNGKWHKNMLPEAFKLVGKISIQYEPQQIMTTINSLAIDTSHIRPKGFRVASFILDGENMLSSGKSKQKLEKGQVVLYLDLWGMVCKAFDEEGSEQDYSFRHHKIVNLVRAGTSSFEFTYQKDQAGSQLIGQLGIAPEHAQEFYGLVILMTQAKSAMSASYMGPGAQMDNDSFELPQLDEDDIQTAIQNLKEAQQGGISASTRSLSKGPDSTSQVPFTTQRRSMSRGPASQIESADAVEGPSIPETRKSLPSSSVNNQNGLQPIESKATSNGSALVEGRPERKVATSAAANVTQQITSEVYVDDDDFPSVEEAEEGMNFQDRAEHEDGTDGKDKEGEKDKEEEKEDEEMQLPPASQQLAVAPANATTRSAKKFGKAPATRPILKPRTVMDSDSDLSEAESSSHLNRPPVATQAINETLLKTVLTKKSTATEGGGFKAPTPRSSGADTTLNSQIQQGLSATPSAVRTTVRKSASKEIESKGKEREMEKNTPRQEGSKVPAPKPRSTASKALLPPPSPRKPRAKRQSQPVQDNEDDEEVLEKHSPLPWEVKTAGGFSKAAPKKKRLSEMKSKTVVPTATPPPPPPPSPPLLLSSPPQQDVSTKEEPTVPSPPEEHEDVFTVPSRAKSKERTSSRTAIKPDEPTTVQTPSQDAGPSRSDAAAQLGSSLANNVGIPKATSTSQQRANSNGVRQRSLRSSRVEELEEDQIVVDEVIAKVEGDKTKSISKSVTNTNAAPTTSSAKFSPVRLEQDRQNTNSALEVEEEAEVQSIESTPRPIVTRKSVEAMFQQLDVDEQQEEAEAKERSTKRARIALLPSSSLVEEDIEPVRPLSKSKPNSKPTSTRRSEDSENSAGDKGKKRKSDESSASNDERRKARRRSSSAEVKAMSEGEKLENRVMKEVEQTLSNIHDLLIKGAKQRIGLPQRQARMARGQFGKLAKGLLDNYHKESKNHFKIASQAFKSANERFEEMKKNEVQALLDDLEGSREQMNELVGVGVGEDRWGIKEVLFE